MLKCTSGPVKNKARNKASRQPCSAALGFKGCNARRRKLLYIIGGPKIALSDHPIHGVLPETRVSPCQPAEGHRFSCYEHKGFK